jgi:phosphoserine phosphatase RsbU/P
MGDVTGKGVEAAALTSLVRHTLRAISEFHSSPAELLAQLDAILRKQRRKSICTAICARVEPAGVTLAVGGHPLPICIDSSGARPIGKFGPLLGAFEDVEWQDSRVELAPGGALVMFTDGVTDAVGEDGERYGASRLRATLEQCRQYCADEVIQAVTNSVQAFQVGEHADDTALLVLRRTPVAAS